MNIRRSALVPKMTAASVFIALVASISQASGFSANAKNNLSDPHPNVRAMNRVPNDPVLMQNRSPLITFRILFHTGSAYDPTGMEGLCALTASMLAGGGSRTVPYDKIVAAMYPIAASFGVQTDKEMTVFTGATHVDNLEQFYSLIRPMLLDPGFRDEDFTRLKTQAINFLDKSLRNGNDEELGKEQLYNMIYAGQPYGHQNAGTISSLQKISLEDIRNFYKAHFTRANLQIGLAGGFPTEFSSMIKKDFDALPEGTPDNLKVASPALEPGTKIDIIQRETRSTAISIGFPIAINRSADDWVALAVATSYLGEHRSSNSHLYQRLREARGLNYGDYAYIEYFPRGMFRFEPNPNLARQQEIFQIWIRPVEPQNGHFALRGALFELDKLVKNGLTQEQFESTRDFLSKFVNVLTASQDAQLGYALDSSYYGTGNFNQYVRGKLSSLKLKDVNDAIAKYFSSRSLRIAMVTKDAAALRDAIIANTPSPITYNSPKPQEITDEDKLIEAYPINVKASDVSIIPVSEVFK